MNDWRKPCEHGRYEPHQQGPVGDPWYCTKSSPVTAADLEGEKVWWCRPWNLTAIVNPPWCHDGIDPVNSDHRDCGYRLMVPVWRLLIPIPDPQPATEGT